MVEFTTLVIFNTLKTQNNRENDILPKLIEKKISMKVFKNSF